MVPVKRCICCGEVKQVQEEFHRHARMGDGHLNKCKVCVRRYVGQWRRAKAAENPRFYAQMYERALELGSETRIAPQKYGRDPIARKAIALRYFHKRRAQTTVTTEFDEFVFTECVRLNALREKVTGFPWHIDHIVPLNHKDACGLHVAANFQSVPGRWNECKSNKSMKSFWPAPGHPPDPVPNSDPATSGWLFHSRPNDQHKPPPGGFLVSEELIQ